MASLRSRIRGFFGGKPAPRATAFSGATSSRLYQDWVFAGLQSADQELKGDLSTLRRRAREMVRNNEYAARFVDLVAENVIGPHGIRLQSRIKKGDGELKTNTNSTIEDAWREWGEPETASVDGRLSWTDIENLAVQSLAQDGEALIRMVPAFANRFGFAVQVLDPDQLDHEYSRAPSAGVNEIRMGVEIDEWGRPVAYHLWSAHPSEHLRRTRVSVPAAEIIHLFITRRPGQTRGVSWFAPVLLSSKMLQGYQEAELVAARTAAAKMGFFKQDADAVGDPNAPGAGNDIVLEAEPGTFATLPPGMSFESWNPDHPNAGFKDFSKSILRGIATGLKVSYNSLANDLESVNYSSIRAGLLSERDVWKRLQRWVVVHMHRRVYSEWLRWALTSGALQLGTFDPTRFRRAVEWQPRGWQWVDPLKDVQASALAVASGLDSRKRLAAEQGRDFEEILEDLDHENQLAEEYGVVLATGAAKPGASQPQPEED